MADNVDDREYAVISPKFDNSGRKIRSQELQEIGEEMSDRFGGVTVNPSVLGCFKLGGDLVCEENAVFRSVRDSSQGVDPDEDEEWVRNLAEDVGDEFGQDSILVSEEPTEVAFVDTDFKESIEKDKTGLQPFQKLL